MDLYTTAASCPTFIANEVADDGWVPFVDDNDSTNGEETGGDVDADDVLQYVPMGSNKDEPVDTKVDAPLDDDQLAEILTRIEGLQKKIFSSFAWFPFWPLP